MGAGVVAVELKIHVDKGSAEKVGDSFWDANVEESSFHVTKEIKQRSCCIQLHYGVVFTYMENGTLRCDGFIGQVSDYWLLKLTKTTIFFVTSVRPSVCREQLGPQRTDFYVNW